MIHLKNLRDTPSEQIVCWLGDIASNLRPEDRDEIEAMSGLDPLVSLTASVMASDMCWVIFENDTPITVFGCGPSGHPDSGIVWMMGTPRMDEVSMRLGRISLYCLQLMHSKYACLWNYIDARNGKSMRWLDWCGFELLEAHPKFGREKRLFLTFARLDHV
jgi:hypothetical protein